MAGRKKTSSRRPRAAASGRSKGTARRAPAGRAGKKSSKTESTPATPSVEVFPWLQVIGARHHNLKNIDVALPLQRFVCVTGVSGSGKSSLVNDIIREALARDLNGAVKVNPGDHDRIDGLEHLDKVIDIDQSPIGRTPRSNPATYIKVFDEIRKLFCMMPDGKVRGYKPGRFSFNVPTGKAGGGRCESCEGNGSHRLEMELLADVWVTCPVCSGRRFSHETLQIHYKGKTIADVLDMDVQEALDHFEHVPRIANMLRTLHDVGLDYVKLGQSSTTLSGGEAQRIKLARELVKKSTGKTLYILDEPTTGLHFEDIRRLLEVLHGFVDAGNSVLVIEHNLDVIKTADWVVDLGPEGGHGGGKVIAEGTPEKVARSRRSHTGAALTSVLDGSPSTGAGHRPARHRKRAGSRRESTRISVRGAAQHNLKGIDVDVPRGVATVCTGPSGSGKTSFAIDTVYTEGQRRYVESLSAYARQFLGRLQPPKVEHVEGLSPSISIEQKNTSRSPRSTVGTVTEIYDYMRVLWSRIGTPYCPDCRVAVGAQNVDEIVEAIATMMDDRPGGDTGTGLLILAPVSPEPEVLDRLNEAGFRRMRIDGKLFGVDELPSLSRRSTHRVEVVVDRFKSGKIRKPRLAESVELALSVGDGVMLVVGTEERAKARRFSQHRSCPSCHRAFEALSPHHFSFNSRLGWCESCEGLGTQQGAGVASVIVGPTRSIVDGAVAGWDHLDPDGDLYRFVTALAAHIGVSADAPWQDWTEAQQLEFLHGCGNDWITVDGASENGPLRFQWRGFFPSIDRAAKSSWHFRRQLQSIATSVDCQACRGSRLRPESAAVQVAGRTIREVCAKPLAQARAWFQTLRLDARHKAIAGELLHEIRERLRFLCDVGLDYVSLHRTAATLSGGEAQRIQLASQIGTGLTGVLYVLDEPTIGLHPRDNARLIAALHRLRDLGNTLLIVEHDRELIESADHVLDFGPGAGAGGGTVTAHGAPATLLRKRHSLTGKYLSGRESLPVPTNRRPVPSPPSRFDLDAAYLARAHPEWLVVRGAREHNLKEVDVPFPLGRFTCVTGVSGSGKSTLVSDILHRALAAVIHRSNAVAGGHKDVVGVEHIDKVINVDQSPIGNSPTSNPATYTGVFDLVREVFAKVPTSRIRGYTANRFSFNRPGGRCEACQGMGQRCIEMHFLPDVWVECESCGGKRYTAETLDVTYHGKSISDVLDMHVSDALVLFRHIPKLKRMLQTLDDVGLGYVQLGQPGPTLSGGEAQRVKLAAELGRPSTGKTLYLLDEPTTGLHFDDLKKLLNVLHRLVDLGNTCICVEHNLDVIKTADWVIELGPEAGAEGGAIVVAGTPEDVTSCLASHTGKFLLPLLEAGPHEQRKVFTQQRQADLEDELQARIRLGEEARMPWQVAGRAWHTENHVDSQGRPVAWDTGVLCWLEETIQSLGTFLPTDWNHRTRVEITAGKSTQWFAHFLTGGHDLLDVSLRVPEGTFNKRTLDGQLAIPTLDEREDLPIYGQWQRVRLHRVGNGWSAVRLTLRDFKDFDRRALRGVLKQAADAYFAFLQRQADDPAAARPWKQDGRKWHLEQTAARKRKVVWRPELLLTTIGAFKSYRRDIEVDWGHETSVQLKATTRDGRIAKIVTNLGEGLRVEVHAPAGGMTPARINDLGDAPEIKQRANGEWIVFWLKNSGQVKPARIRRLLSEARGESKGGGDE